MSSRGGCLSSSAAAAGMQSFQSHKTTPHQPTTTMDMMPMVDAAAAEESSSASSSSSLSPPTSPLPQNQQQPAAKRRAGRKKFRETRHPVYRGVRARAGGRRWVCEVREPKAQARIWLGTYPTPEMAARAHDVAAIALRGAHLLNFPDSAHTLPRARTAAPDDIRCAAAQAAELYRPASTSSGSGSPQQMQMPIITTTTMGAPQPPAVPEEEASSIATATCCCPGRTATGTATACFLDEDAIFDMPGLIDDMARGMLLTPPAMARGGLHLDWGALDDDDDHAVDYCTLWMD